MERVPLSHVFNLREFKKPRINFFLTCANIIRVPHRATISDIDSHSQNPTTMIVHQEKFEPANIYGTDESDIQAP